MQFCLSVAALNVYVIISLKTIFFFERRTFWITNFENKNALFQNIQLKEVVTVQKTDNA